MKLLLSLLIFLSFTFPSVHNSNTASSKRKNEAWVSLFNGKNLDHWIPKIVGYKAGENFGNTFRVEDGLLSIRYDAYDSFNNRFGAFFFDRKFVNYRLRVEYRFVGNTTPGGPSWGYKDGGIQYHCQPPWSMNIDQPFPVCLEYNLLGGNGKSERPTGEICCSGIYVLIDGKRNTSYCTPPAVKKTFPGDEWVTAEIDVKDGKITHYVNGDEIIHFEDPRYDPTNKFAKNFITQGDDRVTRGYISIQSNSHPMDFRKIEIMEY